MTIRDDWLLTLQYFSFLDVSGGLLLDALMLASGASAGSPALPPLMPPHHTCPPLASLRVCTPLPPTSQARGVEGNTIVAASNSIKWVLEFLKGNESYTVDMLTRHTAQLSQLREINKQLGVRRRPLPDLQELIEAGRALEAGKEP